MANALRSLVSGDKRRYTAEGYNLDLTYVTPRLIAMGLPGKGLSSLWRNKLEEVGRFLNSHHAGHYKIFNLGKSTVNYFKLQPNAAWYGWSHKRSPPLDLLNSIVLAIDQWLKLDPLNVAVIHCKEGRERSGVVIASYLLRSGVFTDPNAALAYYADMRTKYGDGVSTPSQIRYVHYMAQLGYLPAPFVPRKIFLRKIIMRPVPEYNSGVNPVVQIQNSNVVPSQTVLTLKDIKTFQRLDFQIVLDVNCPMQGDVSIIVSNKMKIFGLKPEVLMFKFSFNTGFVPMRWTLSKAELDGEFAGPVTDDRLRKGFTVELQFTEGPFDPLPQDPNMQVPQNIPSQNTPPPQYTIPNEIRRESESTASMSNYNPSLYPSIGTSTMEGQSSSYMGWYHPDAQSTVVTPPSTMPPPVNRETKDNRQQLNQASDAVAKATERLLMSVNSMPKPPTATQPNTMNNM